MIFAVLRRSVTDLIRHKRGALMVFGPLVAALLVTAFRQALFGYRMELVWLMPLAILLALAFAAAHWPALVLRDEPPGLRWRRMGLFLLVWVPLVTLVGAAVVFGRSFIILELARDTSDFASRFWQIQMVQALTGVCVLWVMLRVSPALVAMMLGAPRPFSRLRALPEGRIFVLAVLCRLLWQGTQWMPSDSPLLVVAGLILAMMGPVLLCTALYAELFPPEDRAEIFA